MIISSIGVNSSSVLNFPSGYPESAKANTLFK